MEECYKARSRGSLQKALPSRARLAGNGLSISTLHCQRPSQGFEVSLTHRLYFSSEVFLATLPKPLQSVLTQNKAAYKKPQSAGKPKLLCEQSQAVFRAGSRSPVVAMVNASLYAGHPSTVQPGVVAPANEKVHDICSVC